MKTGERVDAIIKQATRSEMPGWNENWKYNFQKQLKKLEYANGYILVKEDTPNIIESCMIFQLLNKVKPYLAYIEVAPNNKSANKEYDHVASCLIAYAFKLSLMRGIGKYQGVLHLDADDEDKEIRDKLIALYTYKYKAYRLGRSANMIIYDEDGEELINKYLI